MLWRIRAADRRRTVARGAWLASAAAVVTAVTLAVTVVFGSAPAVAFPAPLEYTISTPQGAADAPAAYEELRAAALAARNHPLSVTGDVHYVARSGWLVSVHAGDDVEADLIPTVTQVWLGPDGSARMDQSRGAALDLDGLLKSTDPAAPGVLESTDTAGAGTFDPHLPGTLPRDRQTLRAALLDRSALPATASVEERSWALAAQIADLHGLYVIPPDLAAAMWEVLADEPAVRHLGLTTARDGRPVHGFAVAWDRPDTGTHQVFVLHVSTTTGQLIGTETVTVADPALDITEPTVTGFEVWLRTGMVETIGAPAIPGQ
ncbi:hypothetical protein Xcel_0811 [Xylanimonas cellulosilytica DSM 15894]|uniref:CU044_5270 family protein n=2 Tax=Xylanimonas TaxID=186188 RepID=D1BY05_XYLCX|nr:hypothetical protein Xcel_0811 [Xylanimonas cellulosilytica DSM 15894]